MLSLNLARGIRLIEKRNDFPFTNCSAVTLIPLLFGFTAQTLAILLILIFESSLRETMLMVNSTFCFYTIYYSIIIR